MKKIGSWLVVISLVMLNVAKLNGTRREPTEYKNLAFLFKQFTHTSPTDHFFKKEQTISITFDPKSKSLEKRHIVASFVEALDRRTICRLILETPYIQDYVNDGENLGQQKQNEVRAYLGLFFYLVKAYAIPPSNIYVEYPESTKSSDKEGCVDPSVVKKYLANFVHKGNSVSEDEFYTSVAPLRFAALGKEFYQDELIKPIQCKPLIVPLPNDTFFTVFDRTVNLTAFYDEHEQTLRQIKITLILIVGVLPVVWRLLFKRFNKRKRGAALFNASPSSSESSCLATYHGI